MRFNLFKEILWAPQSSPSFLKYLTKTFCNKLGKPHCATCIFDQSSDPYELLSRKREHPVPIRWEKSLIGRQKILTNRCASGDDLLQGLIEFIRLCLPASLSLALSPIVSPSPTNLQYLAFFPSTSFIFSGLFVHPSRRLRSCTL